MYSHRNGCLWYNIGVVNRKEMAVTVLVTPSRPIPRPVKEAWIMLHSTPFFPQDLENYAPWVATHGLVAPYGECQCGCKRKTNIAPKGNEGRGLKRNHPLRYCNGHSTRVVIADFAPWVTEHGLLYPYGYCQCSCGQKTIISTHTDRNKGKYEGHPMRFLHGHHNSKLTLEDAFWCNVVRGQPDECWVWNGTINGNGYGQFKHKDKFYIASRASWELHNGPIPDGLNTLHKCDNPPCVNPSHLFLGTDADNVADMISKGRQNFSGRRKE